MAKTETMAPEFDQVLREHAEFKEIINRVRDFLEQPRPGIGESACHPWAAELSRQLVFLHDKLVRHFHHEEADGLFETLAERDPNAARRIARLEGEHRELLDEVLALTSATLRYSRGIPVEDPRLRRRLGSVLDRLSEHEVAENDLMQRIVYRDLGSGD